MLPLPVNEMTSLDGQKKAEMVKKLHESVRQHIEKKNEQYANKANKGRDANLNRHALRPSKQYWITCPRKLKSEFDRTLQPNVYK